MGLGDTMKIYFILLTLGWAAVAVLNLWMWQKGKAQSALLMLVGGAISALLWLFAVLGVHLGDTGEFNWLLLAIGTLVFAFGFYLSVKPMVAANIAALKEKTGSSDN